MQTEAVLFVDAGEAAVKAIEVPEPGPDQVQVRTRFSSISAGTEGWILHNRFTWAPTRYPCVPGYQRAGLIEAIGPGVTGWSVGDRVVATRSEWPAPLFAQSGAHAGLGNTPVSELYRVPNSVSDVDAAGTVVAQVGYNAAQRPQIDRGDWAVVYGDGLIGQCAAQAMRARGAQVIVVGHRDDRLALAAQYSADAVVNSHNGAVVDEIRRHTGSQQVAVVLDSVQTENAQREYLPLLARARGQIVYCGFTPGTVWADMALLQQHELTAHFVSGWTRPRMEATLALMEQGHLRVQPLITHLVPYSDGAAMYRLITTKSSSFLGITLDWTSKR
jgi:bacteriochlorophyllide a dehydrogenase